MGCGYVVFGKADGQQSQNNLAKQKWYPLSGNAAAPLAITASSIRRMVYN